jgi:uncharacterized protein (DUF924 family)
VLLDQFRRNIYRGSAKAFEKDRAALKLCVEGAMQKKDRGLTPIQRAFFYMPLQHAESQKVQAKSVELYGKLAETVSPTFMETFLTIAQFAELHRDIIDQYGRFPHRNSLLGRENTPEEDEYLAGDAPDFGHWHFKSLSPQVVGLVDRFAGDTRITPGQHDGRHR